MDPERPPPKYLAELWLIVKATCASCEAKMSGCRANRIEQLGEERISILKIFCIVHREPTHGSEIELGIAGGCVAEEQHSQLWDGSCELLNLCG